eukprot:scaffold82507_cov72-Phaeocystis_antarctica.AAC.4
MLPLCSGRGTGSSSGACVKQPRPERSHPRRPGWHAVAPLSTWRATHRLRLELVIVPRDEPTPPHLEQGIEACHK